MSVGRIMPDEHCWKERGVREIWGLWEAWIAVSSGRGRDGRFLAPNAWACQTQAGALIPSLQTG